MFKDCKKLDENDVKTGFIKSLWQAILRLFAPLFKYYKTSIEVTILVLLCLTIKVKQKTTGYAGMNIIAVAS